MIGFPDFNSIGMGISSLLFCGLVALLIIPELITTLALLLPKTISFVSQKKLAFPALGVLLGKVVFWIVVGAFLYGSAFLIDPFIGWYLTLSPWALFAWILALIATVRALTLDRNTHLTAYYTGIYMEYLNKNEREHYHTFIQHVEKLSAAEAKQELANPHLSFLERKALNERVLLSPHQTLSSLSTKIKY